MNKKMILYTLGKMMFVEGLLMLLPFITGLIYREKEGFCYLTVGAFVAASGALLSYRKPQRQQIHAREGFIIVAAAWIFLSLFGALPFILTGKIPHYIDISMLSSRSSPALRPLDHRSSPMSRPSPTRPYSGAVSHTGLAVWGSWSLLSQC